MMVKNKIRAMWARLTLLVVEDDGMSTVEYAGIDIAKPDGLRVKAR